MRSQTKWLIAITILIIIIAFKGKQIMEAIQNAVWDIISENRIQQLHPAIRDKARQFLNAAEQAGIKLRITSGLRTYADQDGLYALGRTKVNPDGRSASKPMGNIVTMAKAGQSWHNFGLAFDVVPVINGEPNWKINLWSKIAAIGKSLGFDWGGDFTTIKDEPHFEMKFGNTLAQLRSLHDLKKVDANGYVMV